MKTEREIKEEICEIGKRIYARGMVASNDGNISVKLNEHEYLCTPTGVSKGFMTPEYICKVDEHCNVLEANEGFRPSSEVKMHMRVYRERPDVKSVVHAHPMYATAFAIAGIPLTKPIMPEAVIFLGGVPIAEYGTPSTEFYAQLMFLAMQLGGPKVLDEKKVEKLYEIRQKFNVQGRHPSQLYAAGQTELLNELLNGKNE